MAKNKRPQRHSHERNRRQSTNVGEIGKTNVAGPHFPSPPPSARMVQGVGHLRAGKVAEAEASFLAALAENPRDALALNCLGIVARSRGDEASAFSFFSRAIEANPTLAEAHGNLGNVLRKQGQLTEALAAYETALRLKPALAEAHNGLGVALMTLGKLDAAAQSLREAVRLNPKSHEAFNNLGNLLREQGKRTEAVEALRNASSLAPNAVEILHNLSLALRDCGELGSAKSYCEQALQIAPQFAEAWSTLATCLIPLGEIAAAADCCERAASLQPNSVDLLINLHNIMRQLDRTDDARTACQRLIALQPNEPLHAIRRSTVWPAVFSSAKEMQEHCRQIEEKWRGWHSKPLPLDLTNLPESICEPPFNSQFIAENVRPLREAYAAIFAEKLTSLSLHGGELITREPTANANGQARIGIVVTSGHEGIFLKSMSGVLRRLNPDVAELVVFCPLASADRIRIDLQAPRIGIISLPARFDRAADTICSAGCKVLLYWEICTDATNYFLPFLRLAPVQCTSWGVQVTSGIPNVDYYLSSKLAEPPHAAEHYSERLLLAETLLTYQLPVSMPPQPRSRESFGFSANHHLYVCAQQLGKFHPDFDLLLSEILKNDPRGLVVVTQDRGGHSSKLLQQRWATTIPAVAERIVFLPRLDSADYLSLIAAADVLLDPVHFGGVNSTYDGLSLGKPIITLPSSFHRGRYTYACYQKMQMYDCVASSPAAYVQLALQVGTDPEFRHEMEVKIVNARSAIFEDKLAVREHERLFGDLLLKAQVV